MNSLALVVGATSDIGLAIATMLAGEGYELALWGRDQTRLLTAAGEVRDLGNGCTTYALDVTDHTAMREELTHVLSTGDLRVVVWAAGTFDWAPADEADPHAWAQVLQVNLTAAAVLTALVMPELVKAAPSAMIFIGSGASRRAYANNAAYVASKHGLAGLAAASFLDVRDHGVKVSIVSPGLVAAGAGLLSPPGQERPESLLTAADVAAAVRFVVTFPARGCPTEIELHPQRAP